ncbi:MAG: hypothetical protein DRP78_03175 [Candidatus Omnitrophota bacterium]|nr:MAG: hypothetical protein DRP78_03175 [Candidatus Omnitrophota bacterium]
MENRIFRFLSIVVCAVIFFSPTSGCVSKSSQKDSKPALVIWHWMSDREDTLQQIAQQYETETGVKVEFQLFAPSEAYGNKVRASAQTDTLPDIYGILAETRDYASFIKAGFVEDLTPYMEANNALWKKQFFKKALSMDTFVKDNQFDVLPGIYGVPIDVTNIQFLYNKDLFAKAGLDTNKPPRTFEQFKAVAKKLKENNIQGLVSGWGEIWMINCLADNFAWNIMGQDKILATIKGEVPYTDPDWIKVFSLFDEMGKSGLLASGMITMVNKHAEQTFANQRAALAFNGSWCVNVYKGMNPDLNYGVFLPPKISDKYPVVVWGGAGSSFKVNAKSKHKEAAIKFLKWITEKKQQIFLSKETHNLPSNRNALSNLSPHLKQFASAMKNTVHPSQLPNSEYPRVIETMGKGIQLIIIGQQTPEELAQKMQKIKEQEMKRSEKYNKK